ncbi:MAG: cardiolipin synthase [Candidatus Izemoplasmatales bacterium]|jgi:cardiolipin synthase|nr:cardiolipin synthase [Candidatus Izemoplasmatales bacterium]
MKKIFMLIALAVVLLFVYTITLVQLTYFASVASIIHQEIVLYVITGIFWFLALTVVGRILLKPTYAYNKSYWLLIIVLNPILGVFLYYLFARDFQTRRFEKTRPLIAQKAFLGLEENTLPHYAAYKHGEIFKYIRKTTGRSIYQDDTYVEVLDNGDEFFPRLIEELKKAKEYIFMEFYIIKNDNIGKKVLNILKDLSLKGVDVYLVYDHFGSNKHLDYKYMKELEKSGVKIGIFDPQTISLFNSNVNFRNHRKAIVIDDSVGFVGGLNLGDEYNHQDKKFGFWRDTHLLLKGNGVTGIKNVFIKDWYYITGKVLDKKRSQIKEDFKGYCSVIESGPDFENGLIKDVYLKMITSAKKSVKIVTPYLIIEPEIFAAIKVAVKSGVDIELLLPGKHDYFAVGLATQSYYEQLLMIGVKIYEYDEVFVHSKILIIDDELASVGTVNIDPRSFHLNFEVTCIFENSAVKNLVNSFNDDLTKSINISLESWKKRSVLSKIIQGWFNLFSPIF